MITTDICIIGGGVIGLMTARECLLSGARVTLIDAQQCGKESSWAGGGIVSPLYPWRYSPAVTALAAWAQNLYPSLCEELFATTQIDSEWQRSGLLILAIDDLVDAVKWSQHHQQSFELLNAEQVGILQSDISISESQSVFFSNVAQVRNPRLLKALKADIMQRGAVVLENTAALQMLRGGSRINSLQTQHNAISAEHYIVCGGAWSAQILQQANTSIAVRPIRGQMLMFAAKSHRLKHIVLKRGRYLIPRRDGRILCGSTVEDVGFDKATTAEARESLLQSAYDMMPSLKEHDVEMHWAGLRPGSTQGIPTISLVNGYDNLFVNAGQFRNGVVLAPASARLMADVVFKRRPIVDPVPYQHHSAII